MKITKVLALILSLLMMTALFTACTATIVDEKENIEDKVEELPEEEKLAENTRVMSLKGPTGMGMAKLMKDGDEKYTFTLTSNPTDVTSALISKTVDIAAVPTNLASTLYNKTEGEIKVIALNTLGVLYILNSDGTVNSLEDLRGKTIGATGQASTPEYILRYVLSKNGIDPDRDVTIEYYTDHAELATRMISGDVKIGMLPEPNVSTTVMKNSAVEVKINLTEEYNKVSDGSALVQGCLVVRDEFAKAYPDTVRHFLEEYKASVEFATTDEGAPAAIVEAGIVVSEEIARRALPNCNIVYIDSESGMKEKLSGFLGVLYEANPASVGGKLPSDDFYYENK